MKTNVIEKELSSLYENVYIEFDKNNKGKFVNKEKNTESKIDITFDFLFRNTIKYNENTYYLLSDSYFRVLSKKKIVYFIFIENDIKKLFYTKSSYKYIEKLMNEISTIYK